MDCRYPRGFEISRLEVLGDPPFLTLDEAEGDYRDNRGLFVLSASDSAVGKPHWFLYVMQGGMRFTLTFYSPEGSVVRVARWEREPAGLRCVETVDLFYPEGDPGRVVPWEDVTNVTREFSSKGVMKVTHAPPGRVSGVEKPKKGKKVRPLPSFAGGEPEGRNGRQHTVRDVALARVPVPAFGEWDELVASSAPVEATRFGDGAARAAEALAATVPATEEKDA